MYKIKNIIIILVIACLFNVPACSTALTDAVSENNFTEAMNLLEKGCKDPNEKNTMGYTPLMIAAGLGKTQMVELLLYCGADVNILDGRMGASALHKASQGGVPEVSKLLIEHGAFINLQAPTNGHTALIDAVWHKNTAVVEYLVSQGANMYLTTNYGATAMDFAKRDNLTEIISILEEGERKLKAEIESQKLMAAVIDNNLEEVKRLIAEGADVNEKSPVYCSRNDGHTPLLVAAREGYTEIVKVLLEAGADPNIVGAVMKATPGHKAGYMGHPEIAKMLVQYGLELNAQGPYNGYTALHDAVWHGHREAAKVYIEAGARLDLRGYDGRTPLDLVIEDGYPDIAEILKEKMEENTEEGKE